MFIRVLMLEGTGLAPSSSISIAVAALILGKAVLLADMLPLINRFPDKPLIYNIAWKTVIYWLISTLIHYVERLTISGARRAVLLPAMKNCSRKSFGRISGLSRSFCSSLIATYCMMHELVRVSEGKGDEDILRTDAGAGSVIACRK